MTDTTPEAVSSGSDAIPLVERDPYVPVYKAFASPTPLRSPTERTHQRPKSKGPEWDAPLPPNHDLPRTSEKMKRRLADVEWGGRVWECSYNQKKLHPYEPSPAIIAGGPKGNWTYAHPYERRPLTVRERARIQTFPDDFVFLGKLTEQRRQSGNAVPVHLARAFADHLAEHLDLVEATST